jgi:hypothetical protein
MTILKFLNKGAVMLEDQEPSPAAKIYPNKGFHSNAEFIAALHPRAIEYLEKAPVLALAFGCKVVTKADRLYVAMHIGGKIARGEKLPQILASVGIASPLRKLHAWSIYPHAQTFIRDFSKINPSALSQAIPDGKKEQRDFLNAIRDWRRRLSLYSLLPLTHGFDWVVINARYFEEGESGDIADFVIRHPGLDFHKWSYLKMKTEVQLWHDRLAAENGVSRFGAHINPDTTIDLSGFPDHVDIHGYEFFKLSTPSMIMEEGRRMRHCVASYIKEVIDGRISLYSIRYEMKRAATLEIRGSNVAQLKGFANSKPSKSIFSAAHFFVEMQKETRNKKRGVK